MSAHAQAVGLFEHNPPSARAKLHRRPVHTAVEERDGLRFLVERLSPCLLFNSREWRTRDEAAARLERLLADG